MGGIFLQNTQIMTEADDDRNRFQKRESQKKPIKITTY